MVLMVVFAILLMALQVARLWKTQKEKTFTSVDRGLWISEFITVLVLVGIVLYNLISYWNYIPSNSPGCLPRISEFGVIANNVDPTKFIAQPPVVIPATTYAAAVTAFNQSANGLANGYFAWNGVSMTVLTSQAYQLSSGASPGNSWVFQSLNTTSVP